MKTQVALFVLTATIIAASGMLVSSLAIAGQSPDSQVAIFSSTAQYGPPALMLIASGYDKGAVQGGGSWRGRGAWPFGRRPFYGYGGTYQPYYYGDDQEYYGTSGQACDWNGWEYICRYDSDYY
jgi:hypothetical protein